ncbi:MAG TPA: quinone oxidoreductase [Blastocatellia bacterium]|nr:quinone oxidoreductase [Blastocatellia bacterium]HMV81574.1 quinone oxidoreductase [Blastocatellia bacterium]HMX27198.1 quinone oxidoreductase [Blastocatellia bacterium]HMY75413.1 quinone oxidoreductase [Blastocatellia bacterium]HMZ20606.1 quinone oxidoreductase [Blastocatellia bacterium]
MKAIVVENPGGPESLVYRDYETPAPKAGEARIKVEAVGLNYIDVYHRTGLYPLPRPFIPGMEAAGTVEAVGEGVTEVAAGDRVAYAMQPGAYAEYVVVPAWKLVKVPDGVTAQQAAATMLQGMTAHYLVTSTYALKAGDTALIHAAAGGVGLILIQLVKRIGARAIGTVSTEAKAELAREAGADEVILYTEQDFEAETRRLTDGKGVQVVYDSVGQTTFLKSLNSLAPRGMLALFGQSSGPVAAFDPALLAQKGSLFLTRPSLAHYAATREELLWRAGELFDWINAGELKLRIEKTFPLAEAAEAHRQLEGRQTTGKVLLLP